MLKIHPGPDEHEKFKKLCALAVSGCLAPLESVELQAHLKHCESCHQVYKQYLELTTQGMMELADECTENQQQTSWDTTPVLEQILARVRTDQLTDREPKKTTVPATFAHKFTRTLTKPAAWMPLAACFVLAITSAAYHLGRRSQTSTPPVVFSSAATADPRLQQLSAEKQQADETLAQQTKNLVQLEADRSDKERELAKVKSALENLQGRSDKLQVNSSQSETQLVALTEQRDALNVQLEALTKAYNADKAELTNLRNERDGMILRTSSLEAKIADLTSVNRDQERRLKDTEQYLSSDRDIRELMGARKLYIADVFDVDGSSRTQKPFGRVFYTQGKSLIFYAFDLDREPHVVNASTFQVWGQREVPQGQQVLPMNLGILYMDNESNRRWVMHFDDPKQLAEIDAVFVTVEPHGGSQKPTTKPFLYALLRNEVNHP
jgi:hypothetical protein